MRIGKVDTNQRVFVIAEVGNNHEGSEEVAAELVKRAAATGVDAVKFQTFKTEQFTAGDDAARIQRLKGFELSYDAFARLAELCTKEGVLFMSTPLDLESAAFLEPHVAAYKIASSDNDCWPLLSQVARTGKPMIVSGGLAGIHQLRLAEAFVRDVWRRHALPGELAILHCVTSYPVADADANLAAIRSLREALDCEIGYSDHTIGIEAAVLSIACGARIVEKHFTLSKTYSDFRDHQLSADPTDLASLVSRIRWAEAALGSGNKEQSPGERELEPLVRRSIATRGALPKGHVLSWSDLVWLRPGRGLAAGREGEVLGRRLSQDVPAGHILAASDLEDAAHPSSKL
ncbi:MAG: N-acetylneuraminate synthase family protein [Polyangiaceae bacterium]